MKKTLKQEVEIKPLLPPNFILTVGNDPVHISEFTEEELRELCMEFTETLIKKSRTKPSL